MNMDRYTLEQYARDDLEHFCPWSKTQSDEIDKNVVVMFRSISLKFQTFMCADAFLERVFYFVYVTDEIGAFDKRLRRVAAGENNVRCFLC